MVQIYTLFGFGEKARNKKLDIYSMDFQKFENFTPRKIEDRNKKIEEQRKVFASLIDMRYNFKQFEILELLPVVVRDSVAHEFQETFLSFIEKKDIAVSFTDEELESLERYDVHDTETDQFVMVGDEYTLCKIETQSMGTRYMLNMVDEIIVFKESCDIEILAEALAYLD
jgi:hypothetical protein